MGRPAQSSLYYLLAAAARTSLTTLRRPKQGCVSETHKEPRDI